MHVKLKDLPPHLLQRLRDSGQLPKKREAAADGMNGTERAYGAHLDQLKAQGVVTWWAFEHVRLKIASGKKAAWYTPDFLVKFSDGRLEAVEIKGSFFREAAKVRLKVAAGLFPWPFVVVRKIGGAWVREEF